MRKILNKFTVILCWDEIKMNDKREKNTEEMNYMQIF